LLTNCAKTKNYILFNEKALYIPPKTARALNLSVVTLKRCVGKVFSGWGMKMEVVFLVGKTQQSLIACGL